MKVVLLVVVVFTAVAPW
jgi:hypothetical protein